MKYAVIFLVVLFPLVVFSAPSITGVTGTVSHGNSVTIAGSGFEAKSAAAPTLWDDCSGTNIKTLWDNFLYGPTGYTNCDSGTMNPLAYRTPAEVGRSVALPHSHITKYMSGSQSCLVTEDGNDVMPWIYTDISGSTAYTYISWYRRLDPNWVWGDGDKNFKDFAWCDTLNSTPYSCNLYLSHYGPEAPNYEGSWYSNTALTPVTNLAHERLETKWVKTEIIAYWHSSTGYIKVYEDGTLKMHETGATWSGDGPQCLSIEGFFRTPNDNNWRYMADIYIDYTLQHVLIGNANTLAGSTTIRAVQIPSAWSDTSITATINQDAFADSATAYLYVVDTTGTANTNGYEITFGGSGPEGTPATLSGVTVLGGTIQ